MHYAPSGDPESMDYLDKFLKQMGVVDHPEPLATLKLSSSTSLPEETRVVVLNKQPGER
jgi:hypothetical protein